MNLDKIAEKVTEIQEQASNIILNPEWHLVNQGIILKDKGKDYTTAVDIAVEREQKSYLKEKFPEIGFLGEETAEEKRERYFWIVDPIDGTAVYSTGGEYYSNSVALADRREKKVIFSSVYQSATGRQFVRFEDEVLIIENITRKDRTKIMIERKPIPSQSKGMPELMGCVILPSKYKEKNQELSQQLSHLFDKVNFSELERSYGMINAIPASGSSALFCCDIASGNRHFYLGYFQKAWDMAGGALFARDSGCIVTPANLEEQIAICNKETLLNVHVFANADIKEIVMKQFNRS